MIRNGNHILIMLNHQDRIALVPQLHQKAVHTAHIAGMHPGAWLVKYIGHAGKAAAHIPHQLQPLRFRFEDSEHQLHTVHITEIIDSRFVEYVGIETFVFLCKALLEGAEKLYELRYTVRTHRWTLFREVY